MINNLLKDIKSVYIAYGVTDFRKQTASLCEMIQRHFNVTPYSTAAFLFCNKKRNSIKVLCYDKNGFILLQKTLLDKDKMKFQWPKGKEELRSLTKEQLSWLLSGLKVCPDKCFKNIDFDSTKIAI